MNILAASALADAPPAPERVHIVRDQNQTTTVAWSGDAGGAYIVVWRETTSPVWESAKVVKGTRAVIDRVNKDDHVFAVGSPGGVPVTAL